MNRSYPTFGGASVVRMTLLCLPAVMLACPAGGYAAAGAREQWLGYRTSQAVATVAGGRPGQSLKVTLARPEGVSLSELAGQDPLFAKWKTPMVQGGFLWLVLDRSERNGAYDRLYIDSDADGSLADETASVAYRSRAYGKSESAEFRQVRVLLTGEDGPAAFHLDFGFQAFGSASRRLLAKAAGWYEGAITIDGVKGYCTLCDGNANGAFNDAFLDFEKSDLVKIATKGELFAGRVGKYVQIGGKLYQFHAARDGAFVRLSSADEGPMGTVTVPNGVQRFTAGGLNGLLMFHVNDGTARIPVGKYRLNHWEAKRQDSSGKSWEMMGVLPAKPILFDVTKQDPARLELAEPVVASVSASKRGKVWRFADPKLGGKHGERIVLTRAGRQVPAPRIHIANADGSYDRRFTFEYG